MIDSFVLFHHLFLSPLQLFYPNSQTLDLLLQIKFILAHSLILLVTDSLHFLAAFAGHLSDLFNLHLLHILLEIVDLIDIDGESFLDGPCGKVEVVLVELFEFYVAGLRVAAWS